MFYTHFYYQFGILVFRCRPALIWAGNRCFDYEFLSVARILTIFLSFNITLFKVTLNASSSVHITNLNNLDFAKTEIFLLISDTHLIYRKGTSTTYYKYSKIITNNTD